MTPSQLFKQYILTETPVVLELPSRTELTALLRALAGLKFRYLRNLEEYSLTELDVFEGRSICHEVQHISQDGTIRVRLYLAHKQQAIPFTVVPQQTTQEN